MLRYFILLLLSFLMNPVQAESLKITTLQAGDGAEAVLDAEVTVHYSGWLMDGTLFDSSRERNDPFSLTLGQGRVIPGWEQGLLGMRVGEIRELIIPPELGYGTRGAGGVIPPNATLRFEVELLAVQMPPYKELDNSNLQELMNQGVQVVDIRRPEEWAQTGVVAGSHLLTAFDAMGRVHPDFVGRFREQFPTDQPVILICRTGSRTATLARALAEQLEYKDVYNVTNGILRWIGEGRPVTRDLAATQPGTS